MIPGKSKADRCLSHHKVFYFCFLLNLYELNGGMDDTIGAVI
jgi:hypothetical protein